MPWEPTFPSFLGVVTHIVVDPKTFMFPWVVGSKGVMFLKGFPHAAAVSSYRFTGGIDHSPPWELSNGFHVAMTRLHHRCCQTIRRRPFQRYAYPRCSMDMECL